MIRVILELLILIQIMKNESTLRLRARDFCDLVITDERAAQVNYHNIVVVLDLILFTHNSTLQISGCC